MSQSNRYCIFFFFFFFREKNKSKGSVLFMIQPAHARRLIQGDDNCFYASLADRSLCCPPSCVCVRERSNHVHESFFRINLFRYSANSVKSRFAGYRSSIVKKQNTLR